MVLGEDRELKKELLREEGCYLWNVFRVGFLKLAIKFVKTRKVEEIVQIFDGGVRR